MRFNSFEELLRYADHIVFNSVRQLKLFGMAAKESGKRHIKRGSVVKIRRRGPACVFFNGSSKLG